MQDAGELSIEQKQSILNLGQQSLLTYARGVHPWFATPDHIDIIAQALEAVDAGLIKRLMIFAPPRHGKSQLTSKIFPAWWQGRHPDKKVIVCAHTFDLAAKEFGTDIRACIQHPLHKAIFPQHRLDNKSAAIDNWRSTAGGKFFAAGINGGATGRGANLLIIDDPIKTKQEAYSVVSRKAVHDFYRAVARTRVEPGGAIVIINTRWHESDLCGWLLDKNQHEGVIDDWNVINLPALALKDEGWRKHGDPLWPMKDGEPYFDLTELQSIKAAVGSFDWEAMYQQRPSAVEGMLVKRAWFPQYYWDPRMASSDRERFVQIMTQPYRIVISIDSALEEGKENDYTVFGAWLQTYHHDYLLDVLQEKMITPKLFKAAEEYAKGWGAHVVLIEDTTASKALVHHMETTNLPIIRWQPKGQKLVRFQAVTPFMEAGKVWLPITAPWKADYLNQLCAFPTAAHDDQCDMTSQFLDWSHSQRRIRDRLLENDQVYEKPINVFDV